MGWFTLKAYVSGTEHSSSPLKKDQQNSSIESSNQKAKSLAEGCQNKANKGKDYKGGRNMTKTGRQCQSWSSSTPHKPSSTVSNKMSSLQHEKNYCRNPDNSDKVWCYTIDPEKRWEYCGVPYCKIQAGQFFLL